MAVGGDRVPTRDRLEEAAIRMFLDSGFDNVRVADIARAAGVTERTFFRHFSCKEGVLLASQRSTLDLLRKTMSAGGGTSAVERVRHALGTVASSVAVDPATSVRTRLLVTTPSLRERSFTLQSEWEVAIADVVAATGEPWIAARTIAAASVAAFRVAVEEWAADPSGGDLAEVVAVALERLFPATSPRSGAEQD